MFSVLCDYITNKSSINTELIFRDIQLHLELLSEHFQKYCMKETYENFDWELNPFVASNTELSGRAEEELAELSRDRRLMMSFNHTALASFWLSIADEYPFLSKKATTILLPFATTYMCETAFSALTNTKTKYRSRLTVDSDLQVCLSQIPPRDDDLCCKKQTYLSR